jgi:hypothetical protein
VDNGLGAKTYISFDHCGKMVGLPINVGVCTGVNLPSPLSRIGVGVSASTTTQAPLDAGKKAAAATANFATSSAKATANFGTSSAKATKAFAGKTFGRKRRDGDHHNDLEGI